jgi:hypothetical protein
MRIEGHGQNLLHLYGPIWNILLGEFKLSDGNVPVVIGAHGVAGRRLLRRRLVVAADKRGGQ